MNALCASVNFDAFIVFSSPPSHGRLAESSCFKRSSREGVEHSGKSKGKWRVKAWPQTSGCQPPTKLGRIITISAGVHKITY